MKGTLAGERWPTYLATAALFHFVFVGSYLATVVLAMYTPIPANPWLGGRGGLLLRPEPVVIPAALAFGWPAVVGTIAGVLIHNLLFRIVPGGVSLAFSLAQTAVVAVASYVAMAVKRGMARPFNNLAATWVISAFLVLVLGTFSALEVGTPIIEEWEHVFRENFLPVNVLGLLILEGVGLLGARPET